MKINKKHKSEEDSGLVYTVNVVSAHAYRIDEELYSLSKHQ